jgi:pyroglutamyl-peptidase
MRKRVLISGFEPFGGQPVNPTALLIEALLRGEISRPIDCDVRGAVLPVTFGGSFEKLQSEIQAFEPHFVLSLGQAGGRSHIEIERVAINCIDAEIPDNSGFQPQGESFDLKIDRSGDSAYFTTLPARTMLDRLTRAGISARMSNSAGTYVCNFLFYRLQELTQFSVCRSGFVHFPFMKEQVVTRPDTAAMDFPIMKRALELMLESLINP